MNALDIVGDVASSLDAIADLPSDPDFHDTSVLLAELATLNQNISRYITAALDADAKRGKPVDATQEARLAQRLIDLGQRLQRQVEAVSRN